MQVRDVESVSRPDQRGEHSSGGVDVHNFGAYCCIKMDLRLGTQGIFGKRGSQLLGQDINPTPMVLRQIIVPGGVQVQDTSCVRPEDQDDGENDKGSIKKNGNF